MNVNKWVFLLIQFILLAVYWLLFFELASLSFNYLEVFSPVTHLIFALIIFTALFRKRLKQVHWSFLLVPSGLMILAALATSMIFIQSVIVLETGTLATLNIFSDLFGRLLVFLMVELVIFRKSSVNSKWFLHILTQYILLVLTRVPHYMIDIDIFSELIFFVIINEFSSLIFVFAYVHIMYKILNCLVSKTIYSDDSKSLSRNL